MAGAVLYTQGVGSKPQNVEVPFYSNRAPNPVDMNYPIGKRWINSALNLEYVLTSKSSFTGSTLANWVTVTPEAFYISAVGVATLVDGTVTVANTYCLSTSNIILTNDTLVNQNLLKVYDITNGSFTIASFGGTDGSTVSYMIVN
jgi:hypothetical protein